jgi:hypothetical protein
MWILLRIAAAVCGALYRYATAFRRARMRERIGEIQYSDKRRTTRRGRMICHRIGVELTMNVCFALTKESRWDRLFKLVGLSEELQTGDRDFDERIYIACDHLGFYYALRKSAEARKLVHDMIADGCNRIWSNGHTLYASARKPIDTDVWVPRLDRLRIELARATTKATSRFGDSFTWRVLVVEAIVWGMAGYAAGAAFDYFFHRYPYHLDSDRLLVYGAAAAVMILLGLLALIVLFLQRSSRSHRILVESVLLLVLSTPVLGVQLVSDINRSADDADSILVRSLVTHRWRQEHRGKRGIRWYSHHVQLDHVDGEVPVQGQLDISSEVFWTLSDGATIPIEIGRGRLGLRWYKRINGVPVGD